MDPTYLGKSDINNNLSIILSTTEEEVKKVAPLPFEIMNRILFNLSSLDIQRLTQVNHCWKIISIGRTKFMQLSKLMSISNFLILRLKENFAAPAKSITTLFQNQFTSCLNLTMIRSSVARCEGEIVKELEKIKEEELEALTLASEDQERPEGVDQLLHLASLPRKIEKGKADLKNEGDHLRLLIVIKQLIQLGRIDKAMEIRNHIPGVLWRATDVSIYLVEPLVERGEIDKAIELCQTIPDPREKDVTFVNHIVTPLLELNPIPTPKILEIVGKIGTIKLQQYVFKTLITKLAFRLLRMDEAQNLCNRNRANRLSHETVLQIIKEIETNKI